MEINKQVTPGDDETFSEVKDGIWRFPSCLIQDSPCIKEEVKDEITVEEGGVYCKVEEESKTHSQYQAPDFLDYTISDWPVKVELTEELISQEWRNVCVKETGDIG
jgi:hypothetical protein